MVSCRICGPAKTCTKILLEDFVSPRRILLYLLYHHLLFRLPHVGVFFIGLFVFVFVFAAVAVDVLAI